MLQPQNRHVPFSGFYFCLGYSGYYSFVKWYVNYITSFHFHGIHWLATFYVEKSFYQTKRYAQHSGLQIYFQEFVRCSEFIIFNKSSMPLAVTLEDLLVSKLDLNVLLVRDKVYYRFFARRMFRPFVISKDIVHWVPRTTKICINLILRVDTIMQRKVAQIWSVGWWWHN